MICGTALIITGIWRSTIDTIDSYEECLAKLRASQQTERISPNMGMNYCSQYPRRFFKKYRYIDEKSKSQKDIGYGY